MSADKADEALNALYQQRKNAVVAPDIRLPSYNEGKRAGVSLTRIMVALLGGGLASFGILAVISQLAKSPMPENIPQTITARTNPVEYQVDDLSELQAQAVAKAIEKITNPLPEVPKIPAREVNHVTSDHVDFPTVSRELLNEHLILTIKQSAINLTLNHKVLPEFPNVAQQQQRSGYVKLSYQVTEQGSVENIKLLAGHNYRVFQEAAINALGQWRYTKKAAINDKSDNNTASTVENADNETSPALNNHQYEIVFEFISAQ